MHTSAHSADNTKKRYMPIRLTSIHLVGDYLSKPTLATMQMFADQLNPYDRHLQQYVHQHAKKL